MFHQFASISKRKHAANRLALWLRSFGESALNPVLLSGRPRWRGLEPLEGRVMLSGVTIITHGRDGDSVAPEWLTAMASAIVERTGSDTAVYNLRISASGGTGPAVFEAFDLLAGLSPSDPNSNGETIILLDWADASGFAPQNYHNTSSIAGIVTHFLVNSVPSRGISRPLAESPIHLIGHSRGTSVVSQLAEQMGLRGIWVDQVTTLDPHPLNYLSYSSDPAPVVFSNVVFADNYWRQDGEFGEFGDFDGQPVAGAFNFELNESILGGFPSDSGYFLEHSDVHLFYYGTMNLSSSAASEGVPVPAFWYPTHGVSRNTTGYHYSRIGGGDRSVGAASAGLHPLFGNSGITREPLDLSGATWPSLIYMGLNDDDLTYTVGDLIRPVAFYADVDSGGSITYFLDKDTNPYNTDERILGQHPYQATGDGVFPSQPTFSTAAAAPGIYHVYAQITDSGGLTRFLYAPSTVQVVAPPAPEAEVRGNGGVIVDGDTTPTTSDHTDFGSVNQGETTVSRTFTMFNTGTTTLTISGLTVPAGFTITEGLSASIAVGSSDTFTIRLDSAVLGTKSGQISFINNDSDENPYNFSITGTVNVPQPTAIISSANKNYSVPGTSLKVSLKGAGSVKIWAGVSGAIDRIELTGSNSKSSLTVTPVNKDTTGRVGEIVVGNPDTPNDRTSLGGIVGKLVELTGGISIAGGLKTLTLAGATNAASIVIGADLNNIALTTVAIGSLSGTTFTTGTPIKTFTTNYWLDAGNVASLAAPSVGTMSVKGSMEADVSVTDPWVASSLKKLAVAGALRNVEVRSAGSIGAVAVGSITGSRILAGIRSAVAGAPASQADFTGDYSLTSFTTKGSFTNSVLAASRILKVSLDSVAANAGGNKFGVYSRETPKNFKRGDVVKGYKLTPVVLRPTDIEPFENDDFEVRVI